MLRLRGERQRPLFGEACPACVRPISEALHQATGAVIGQESAEVIVVAGRRDYPNDEGPNVNEWRKTWRTLSQR